MRRLNELSIAPIGAPTTGAGHMRSSSGCISHRHSHNQRRKRRPAAMAVTVAFAPTLDEIGTATTAVTIGWIVGVARVRISPAIAVNPGVPPSVPSSLQSSFGSRPIIASVSG